jgi:hypothetical protein
MLEFNVSRPVSADEEVTTADIVRAALVSVPAKLIGLIAARAPETYDRYAEFRSRSRTPAATELIARVFSEIEQHEQRTRRRFRSRRERSRAKFTEALERFVGDLLRARTGTNTTGRIYRPTGKSDFSDAPVKYDMFMKALDGLKALGFVEHRKGRTRSRDTGFGFRVTVPGRAARFWATPKLVKLAEEHGINSGNVGDHFFPEPPTNPLVLKDYATGRGQNKESGRKIKYKRTPETDKLERDVKELNEFLARFKITGARHEGYIRTFNNCAWDKGGRLYSVGEGNYQLMPEHKRLEMKINGEPVAEIDIKASHLTIYHAMVGEPLEGLSDPYARAVGVGIDRDVAKRWCLESLGHGAPKTKWSSETVKDYREKGQELPKARTVTKAMLEAFPALKKLEEHRRDDLWADLQFKEAEAIIRSILILKRRHEVLSLSMHDGLIVPRSKADLAKDILAREYRRHVGVDPMLTVEPDPKDFDARYF